MTDDPAPPPSGNHDQLREEAAAWFARMRGDDARQHQAAFDDWLARGAVHRAAYNRIGEVFAAGKILKSDTERADKDDRHQRRHLPIALLAGAVVTLAVVGIDRSRMAGDQTPRATNSSAVLELAGRKVPQPMALPGGGKAVLDVDGLVATKLAGMSDVSRLERGRARFAMLPSSAPQRILVGDYEARSSSGTFDLWLRPDGSLDAQVIDGSLELRPAVLTMSGTDRLRLVRLTAGQRYRVDPSGRPGALTASAGVDWPQGILEFRQTPLGDVIQEANRYSAIKIVLANPALAPRRVSGRFRIDNPVRLAQRLAIVLSLVLDQDRPGLLLLHSPEKTSQTP